MCVVLFFLADKERDSNELIRAKYISYMYRIWSWFLYKFPAFIQHIFFINIIYLIHDISGMICAECRDEIVQEKKDEIILAKAEHMTHLICDWQCMKSILLRM